MYIHLPETVRVDTNMLRKHIETIITALDYKAPGNLCEVKENRKQVNVLKS